MSSLRPYPLTVDAEWLAANLGKPGIKVFDAPAAL